ncbi:DUF2306 domain-containing protein [Larkinella soli]|uniref:DUF2306 domain-containing protein n=1 Tax=Larkinella soli TaxID=1770527 RepID=UPI000FFC7A3F|nr:DUF2306 domain-containing protein [Larkinella soli]
MNVFVKGMLLIHIAAGFTALLVGVIPMIARKGSRLHNTTGLVFYWCMAVVCLTAVYLVFFKPSSLFLLFIAMLSFYFCFSGRRLLRLKKAENRPERIDRIAAYGALAASLLMLGLGGRAAFQLATGGNGSVFDLLYLFFGGLLYSNARYDVVRFHNPLKAKYGKMEWFFGHINRMVGSYIATLTAFATVNTRMLPEHPILVDIAAWTLPGVIGGLLISRWIAYYHRKFNLSRTSKKAVPA